MTAPKGKNPTKKTSNNFDYGELLMRIMSKFGIGGGIIVVCCFVFLVNGTDIQKQEFIDRYILLKFDGDHPVQYFALVITLVLILAGQSIYYKKKTKLKDERILELENQNEKLIKKLPSASTKLKNP